MASQATARDTRQGSLYKGYALSARHAIDQGVAVLPLADASPTSGSPVEIITLYQPVRTRTVAYDANKANAPPIIPTPKDNAAEIFLGATMEFPLPAIDPTRGSLIWSAFGEQTFVDRGAWTVATGFRIGDYPVASTPLALSAFAAAVGGLGQVGLGAEGWGNAADFDAESYDGYEYDWNTHFPSHFMVDNLALGD